jgi:hypothetical protein
MNVTLIIMGILGLTMVAVAAYVFMFAARNYVSGDDDRLNAGAGVPETRSPQSGDGSRGRRERRKDEPVHFPLTVNGILIPADRRQRPSRQ